jgi:PAS domain-containing protein
MKDPSGTTRELLEEIASLKERIRELERSDGRGAGRETPPPEGTAGRGEPVSDDGDHNGRKGSAESLQWKVALLEAQMNTSIDGILVIDENRRRLVINQRIIEMWDVPRHILNDENDESCSFTWRSRQVSGAVPRKVNYLYDHPCETSRDR